MSMHICGPALTTTSYKKRTEKITKAMQAELEQGWRERNQRLKQINLPKETFEQYKEWVYGRGKDTKKKTKTISPSKVSITTKCEKEKMDNQRRTNNNNNDTKNTIREVANCIRDWTKGPCSSKPSPTYTGLAVLGISQMHKSNSVPVFSNQEVIDISKMRR